MSDDVQPYDPNQPGLFPSPKPVVWFCGVAMGGYGDYESLDHSVDVLSLVVPVDMLSGYNFNDMDTRQYRERLAELLMEGVQ